MNLVFKPKITVRGMVSMDSLKSIPKILVNELTEMGFVYRFTFLSAENEDFIEEYSTDDWKNYRYFLNGKEIKIIDRTTNSIVYNLI